jgi:hypothetical protein
VVLMVAARGILETAHIEFLLFVRFVGTETLRFAFVNGLRRHYFSSYHTQVACLAHPDPSRAEPIV